MPKVQVAIDCAEPDRLSTFWAEVLDYVVPPAPDGFETWDDWYRSIGVPEEDLGIGNDRLVDPEGIGPDFWFQRVPEPKVVKNRVHIDIAVSGGREVPIEIRRERINAKAEQMLALGATVVRWHDDEVDGHYAVTMQDIEGNEFCFN